MLGPNFKKLHIALKTIKVFEQTPHPCPNLTLSLCSCGMKLIAIIMEAMIDLSELVVHCEGHGEKE